VRARGRETIRRRADAFEEHEDVRAVLALLPSRRDDVDGSGDRVALRGEHPELLVRRPELHVALDAGVPQVLERGERPPAIGAARLARDVRRKLRECRRTLLESRLDLLVSSRTQRGDSLGELADPFRGFDHSGEIARRELSLRDREGVRHSHHQRIGIVGLDRAPSDRDERDECEERRAQEEHRVRR